MYRLYSWKFFLGVMNMFIKKLFSLILLGLFIQSVSPCVAGDLYLMFDIYPERKTKIHKEIVTRTGLGKKQPDNYHVTIASIKNIDEADHQSLEMFLKAELKKICKEDLKKGKTIEIEVQLKDAARYTVNRNKEKCPVALFFDITSLKKLRGINKSLSDKLTDSNSTYSAPSGKKYQFCADTKPGTYQPHITVADTGWVNKCSYTRDHIIGKLNEHIKAGKEQDKSGRGADGKWATKFLLTAQ